MTIIVIVIVVVLVIDFTVVTLVVICLTCCSRPYSHWIGVTVLAVVFVIMVVIVVIDFGVTHRAANPQASAPILAQRPAYQILAYFCTCNSCL
jgi:hypothetical protein